MLVRAIVGRAGQPVATGLADAVAYDGLKIASSAVVWAMTRR